MFPTRNLVFLTVVFWFGLSIFPCDRNEVHQITQITSGPIGEIGPRCSPDGRYLAFEYFSAEHPNAVQVWSMPIAGEFSEAKSLLGYTGKSYGEISWSPDSAWLSFIGGSRDSSGVISDQVFKINVASQKVAQLTNFPSRTSLGAGTSWSKDGQIAFEMDDDIYVVPQSGGAVAKLVSVKTELPGIGPFFPSWSPDGGRVAFVGRTAQKNSLYVADLGNHRIEKIFDGVGDDAPWWLDDRHVLSSHVEGQSHSSIWMIRVRDKRGVRLTQGFYDISPVGCVGGKQFYFSRNKDISQGGGSLMRGFHIWKAPIPDFSP